MTIPPWIDPEAWAGFKAMRIKIKAPMTERAEKMCIKRLGQFRDAGHDPNAILEQSEFNDWKDVYAVKDKPIERVQAEPQGITQANQWLAEQAAVKPNAELARQARLSIVQGKR